MELVVKLTKEELDNIITKHVGAQFPTDECSINKIKLLSISANTEDEHVVAVVINIPKKEEA